MNHIALSAVATFTFIAGSSFAGPPTKPITVEILNETNEYVPDQIYLGISGSNVSTSAPSVALSETQWQLTRKMSDLYQPYPDAPNHRSFTLMRADSSRFYFSFDKVHPAGQGGVCSGQDPTLGFAPPFVPPYDTGYDNNPYDSRPYPDGNPPPRFDKIELTFIPGQISTANLTAVDFYGIPFKLEAISNGIVVDQVGFYKNHSSIYNALRNAGGGIPAVGVTYAHGAPSSVQDKLPLDGFARFLSITKALSSHDNNVHNSWAGAATTMQQYVAHVLSTGSTVNIKGTYSGSITKGRPPCNYDYTGTFTPSGQITLTPNPSCSCAHNYPCNPTNGNCPHDPGQDVTIDLNNPPTSTPTDWVTAIFSCQCDWLVGTSTGNFNDDDYYAAIVRDLLSGFNYGYVDGYYNNPPYSTTNNDSSVWYGYPYCAPFACAQPHNPGWYTPYAEVISEMTGSYGFPFTDKVDKPLVQLTDQIDTLRITILDDDGLEAPTITSAGTTTISDRPAITVDWEAVQGAVSYKLSITPPFPATEITTAQTTYTVESPYVLDYGTPYEIRVAAVDSYGTENESKPVVVKTTGSANHALPENATLGYFSFTVYMPDASQNYLNHTLTFNGCSHQLTSYDNHGPDHGGWNFGFHAPAVVNSQNYYVFNWSDDHGKTVFDTVLFVNAGAKTPSLTQALPCNGVWPPQQSTCSGSPCWLLINKDDTFLMHNGTSPNIPAVGGGWTIYQNLAPLPNPVSCSSVFETSCAADLDGSGQVDGSDLNALLANWGQSGTGDINGDGIVAGHDVARVLSGWGPCGG